VKKLLVLLAIALIAMPVMGARIAAPNLITHTPCFNVYQAYAGDSNGTDLSFPGALAGSEVISAVPGVLSIVPGTNWDNFVSNGTAAYGIKGVKLTKVQPGGFIECNTWFNGLPTITQGTGTSPLADSKSIRLWWPLMYEAPGTTWTLEVRWTYCGSATLNIETWCWNVDVTFASLNSLVKLFHELPFGLCEVPLIGDEVLYSNDDPAGLLQLLAKAEADYIAGHMDDAALSLNAFEEAVYERCITDCPPSPAPTGDALKWGIANTKENPACCKLVVDAEALAFKLGIFSGSK